VTREKLKNRARGIGPKQHAHVAQQCLHPAEEKALEEFILGLSDRGFPITTQQLTNYANYIVRQCNPNFKGVGLHWTSRFLSRHPRVQFHWRRGLDQAQASAADPAILKQYFDLVRVPLNVYVLYILIITYNSA
jgi:hypothetical protein